MQDTVTRDSDRAWQAGIVAWFVSLIRAHFRQEHREAAEAMDALKDFGVSVKFRPRSRNLAKGRETTNC